VTVRSGRGPRDSEMPSWRASDGRGNPPVYSYGRRPPPKRGFRLPGIIKFLLFAGVLAGVVLIVMLTALRPVVQKGVAEWAWSNPWAITRIPFVAEFVRDDLGDALTSPAGSDPAEDVFVVNPGDTPNDLAPRLAADGYVTSERAFLYVAITTALGDHLASGSFVLRRNMTAAEVVDALVNNRLTIKTLNVTFREGLRIEQMTALLQTLDTAIDPQEFYDLATNPPPELLADYQWLHLPKGARLEGFLYPDTYEVVTESDGGPTPVTSAEDLIRMLLDQFLAVVGEERMTVPDSRGMTFYEIVTLASIVEHEAGPGDQERALIAGVYQNRLDGLNGVARILNADPTVKYAVDTMALEDLPFDQWQDYFFWEVPPGPMAEVAVDPSLQGFQTYQVAGLIPSPISTPSLASIDAALEPNQAKGFLYFVLIPDSDPPAHAFAKTFAKHQENLRKYGYL
jgi:peptidoglycan lytic transglycosylase G